MWSDGCNRRTGGRHFRRQCGAGLKQAQAQQVGTNAYVYGISLMEFLRQLQQNTSVTVPDHRADAPINQLGNDRTLASAGNEAFVGPNLDTLYTFAHVDLSKGPLVLHVPAVPGGRYYSFEFLDPYTNVFHYVGTRTTGDGAGNFAIVGPTSHDKLPAGVHRVSSDYEHIWLVGRTQVHGDQTSDLPAVHSIQNGYKLIPLKNFEQSGLRYTAPKPKKIITTPTVATRPDRTGLPRRPRHGPGAQPTASPRRGDAGRAQDRRDRPGPILPASTSRQRRSPDSKPVSPPARRRSSATGLDSS